MGRIHKGGKKKKNHCSQKSRKTDNLTFTKKTKPCLMGAVGFMWL